MTSVATPSLWISFVALVLTALSIDLRMLHRRGARRVGVREALHWTLVWITVALVFAALLWIWLRTGADDYLDAPDLFDVLPPRRSGSGGSCHQGSAHPSADISLDDASVPEDSSSAFGDALGAAAEADEFAIPLIILVLVAALLLSSLFIVYSAPLLFAELLVDGVLAASLYRRLRRLESRHWLDTAFRRTVVPFLLTAAVVSACGWGMTQLVPDAHSIGQVLSHLNKSQ